MTLIEEMAIAVLKGDLVAARALADCLLNELQDGTTPIRPIQKLTSSLGKVRVVVYFSPDVEVDRDHCIDIIQDWLSGRRDNVLVLHGCDRLELYELTDGSVYQNEARSGS